MGAGASIINQRDMGQMIFNEYKYLWPPRPLGAIPVNLLGWYEKKGWVGKFKKNGTCTVLYVRPDKSIITKNRHNEDHKAWKPSAAFVEQFGTLPGADWFVFAGELLHSKTKHIKDTIYLFDLLVDRGEYLVGVTLKERLRRLQALFPRNAKSIYKSHYVVSPKLWVAETLKGKFKETFQSLTSAEDEGLVIKNPNSKLKMCLSDGVNAVWQVKCRRVTKNYTY